MDHSAGLGDDEVQRRLPVWCALTDFFLDTEMTEHDFRHVARVAQKAGYTPTEIEAMLFDKVGPVFGSNLLTPVGEWAPWPDSFVEEKMCAWCSRPRRTGRITGAVLRRMLRADWARLQPYLAGLQQETAP